MKYGTSNTATADNPDSGTNRSEDEEFEVIPEVASLLHLSIPSIAIQFSMFFLYPQSASVVGRKVGTEELAGFALGSLVGNLTCLSVIVGALSAADTLMPRAYGRGDYNEVGFLAIRGACVCTFLLLPPILLLCTALKSVLLFLGQDPVAAALAAHWIPAFAVGVPANMLFRVIQRFLVCQHRPWPPVFASVIPCVLVHPFLLQWFVAQQGLVGSAIAISCTQWTMLCLLLTYLTMVPTYHPETWLGLSPTVLKHALQPEPCFRFLRLSMGGVLSLSEWWFWETMVFVAGSFGITALCAHTIAYNIIPLLAMVPLGTSIGLSVRIGNVIGESQRRAKKIAAWTMGIIIATGLVASTVLWGFRDFIISLFTDDPEVIDMCKMIWGKMCVYIVILYSFFINGGILRALGMQWHVALVVIVCLWCILLPLVLFFAVYKDGGLDMQWSLLPILYAAMQGVLAQTYISTDWGAHSGKENTDQRALPSSINEETSLLGS